MRTLDWIAKKLVLKPDREVALHFLRWHRALFVGDPGSANLLLQEGRIPG